MSKVSETIVTGNFSISDLAVKFSPLMLDLLSMRITQFVNTEVPEDVRTNVDVLVKINGEFIGAMADEFTTMLAKVIVNCLVEVMNPTDPNVQFLTWDATKRLMEVVEELPLGYRLKIVN